MQSTKNDNSDMTRIILAIQYILMIPQFFLDGGPLKMNDQSSRTYHEDVGSNKHHMKSPVVTPE
jgi:hypothetical protein